MCAAAAFGRRGGGRRGAAQGWAQPRARTCVWPAATVKVADRRTVLATLAASAAAVETGGGLAATLRPSTLPATRLYAHPAVTA